MSNLIPLYVVLVIVLVALKIAFWTWRCYRWRRLAELSDQRRAAGVIVTTTTIQGRHPYGRLEVDHPYHPPPHHPPPHHPQGQYPPAAHAPPPPYSPMNGSSHNDVPSVNPDPDACPPKYPVHSNQVI